MPDQRVGTLSEVVDCGAVQSGTGGMKNIAATLEKITQQHLGLETLQTRKSDRLDFHDMSVWSLEAALRAAYEAGQKAGVGQRSKA